jgi:hypothetical protein
MVGVEEKLPGRRAITQAQIAVSWLNNCNPQGFPQSVNDL